MPKVIKTGVQVIKGSLGTLAQEAERLLANKHVRMAARTRSSVDGALGLGRHQDEQPEVGV
jgi:hypothetical protein